MASFPNQDIVIREVGKAYDQIKKLQALLQFKSRKFGEDALCMHELAQPLFQEALQGLNHSLCIMKSGMCKMEVKQEIMATESGASGCATLDGVLLNDSDQKIASKRGKRRRTENNSWTCTTTMPYDDGYQWRKYGDKKISGTNFSRSYFRCTFKEEQGCLAKKLVQETTNKDQTNFFHVTYTNEHTCNSQIPVSPPVPVSQSDVYEQKTQRGNCMAPNYLPSYLPDNSLMEALSSRCGTVQRSGEWDFETLIMELVGFDSSDAHLLLT
ncbi:WRKY transcription factor 55-like [Carex rostrata]